jgi:hypothetical protein
MINIIVMTQQWILLLASQAVELGATLIPRRRRKGNQC